MKRFLFSGIASTLLFGLMWGCSESPTMVEHDDAKAVPVEQTDFICAAMAKEIAAEAVEKNVCSDGWQSNSQVTSVDPIYIDGIDKIGYWECKVETDGSDAGYVIVTANQADILVPEQSQTGKTLTETYRRLTGKEDITICRYDWFRSAAYPGKNSGLAKSAAGKKPLATIGFENDFENSTLGKSTDEIDSAREFEEFAAEFASKAQQNNCFPRYTPENVANYYKELLLEEITDEGLSKTAASWRDSKAELSNKCSTPSGSRWHTPQWKQFKKSNGYSIGCGAVAWGIVYGYWDAFKGKSKLFGSTFNAGDYTANGDEKRTQIKNVITQIASDIGTVDVNSQGLTWPSKMEYGYKYGRSCGYGSTRVIKDNGSEYSKFNTVKNSLDNNRPVILLIHADGIGIVNHYVVIERARKTQTKYLWKWHDRNVYYKVNYGWGNTRKEICVRDWGTNDNKVYTATSVYDIKVQ